MGIMGIKIKCFKKMCGNYLGQLMIILICWLFIWLFKKSEENNPKMIK